MPIKNIGYPNLNDKVIISDETLGRTRKPIGYLCPNCQIRMVKLSDDDYFCNRCQHSEYIENVVKTTEIPKPQTLDNSELHVSTTPQPINPFAKKPIELKGGFKALSQKGTIRFTSYNETSPKSDQSQNWNQSSSSSMSWSSSNEGKVRKLPGPTREEDDNKIE
jgi:hypothetical protein